MEDSASPWMTDKKPIAWKAFQSGISSRIIMLWSGLLPRTNNPPESSLGWLIAKNLPKLLSGHVRYRLKMNYEVFLHQVPSHSAIVANLYAFNQNIISSKFLWFEKNGFGRFFFQFHKSCFKTDKTDSDWGWKFFVEFLVPSWLVAQKLLSDNTRILAWKWKLCFGIKNVQRLVCACRVAQTNRIETENKVKWNFRDIFVISLN